MRRAWADPLGWAGLLGMPAHGEEVAGLLAERVGSLEREIGELDEAIAVEGRDLRSLQAQASSLGARAQTRALAGARAAEAREREASVRRLRALRTDLGEELRAHRAALRRPPVLEPARAHLRGARSPFVEEQERRLRFLRLWSVVSTPLLLAAVVLILNTTPLGRVTTIVAVVGAFAGVEAFARRRLVSFLASVMLVAGALGLVAVLLALAREHWRLAVSVILAAAALALLVGNLRDLRHGWRRG